MFEQVVAKFSTLPQIEAIALGGSRAGTQFDESSDYDIYLYCTEEIPENIRKDILLPYCKHLEIGNHFWELEDNGSFCDGIDFDILYRNLDSFSADVARTVEQYQVSNAYNTCMWHNLLTCKILYDRDGRLAAAKERFSVPYPDKLRQNILSQGWRLLNNSFPAYSHQIEKAAHRGDLVSINHRATAFLETYFDVLFALNYKTHPGEKRLVSLCLSQCPTLPDHFEDNINQLLSHLFGSADILIDDMDRILTELAKIL